VEYTAQCSCTSPFHHKLFSLHFHVSMFQPCPLILWFCSICRKFALSLAALVMPPSHTFFKQQKNSIRPKSAIMSPIKSTEDTYENLQLKIELGLTIWVLFFGCT
jgi:hypothetical protein